MRLLITLVVVAVLSWALARPLRSHSMLFYLAAVALAGAGAYLTIAPPAVLPLREVAFVVQKGYVAFALFAVVMMMGVLDKRSAVRRRLQPVRAQLSLLGTILIAGHIGFYAVVYLEILGSVGASNPSPLPVSRVPWLWWFCWFRWRSPPSTSYGDAWAPCRGSACSGSPIRSSRSFSCMPVATWPSRCWAVLRTPPSTWPCTLCCSRPTVFSAFAEPWPTATPPSRPPVKIQHRVQSRFSSFSSLNMLPLPSRH